jgi:hypothetical protein
MEPLKDNEKWKHSIRLIKESFQEISLRFHYFSALFFEYFFEKSMPNLLCVRNLLTQDNFKRSF